MNPVSKGRHRRRAERVTVAGAVPVALAIVCSGVANSAPQAGLGVEEEVQPGFFADEVEEAAPAPAEEPKEYWVAPPVEYNNVPTRTVPTSYYDYDEPVAPASFSDLHLPVAVEPVAPIEAPKERLRLGDYVSDQPNWMSDTVLERTNNTAAVYEAQMNTFWRSTGLDASRADRIGAATIGGAAVTGIGAAAAAGATGAVVGALIGGTIGGTSGLAPLSGAAATVLPLIPGVVAIGTVTTVMGAGIGAAVVGVPTAVVAGVGGAVVGAAHGMAFGAGDTLGEPKELHLEQAPTVDAAAVTENTRDTLEQIEALPGGQQIADAIRNGAFWLPPQLAAMDEQVRGAVSSVPGGAGVIAAVDAGNADAAAIFEPQVEQSGVANEAVQAGLV
ncbi:insoluble domain protein [Rhodococcus gannanensis]|uniref:Insoluble domain protein n=1 Tax=Rhodococcus gannanensis TaxID=1960308 RepID=A0ABW4P5F7_9NOCA